MGRRATVGSLAETQFATVHGHRRAYAIGGREIGTRLGLSRMIGAAVAARHRQVVAAGRDAQPHQSHGRLV